MSAAEQLDATGVQIVHHFATGLYSKEMRVPAGVQIGKHMHDFDHFSALMLGTAEVDVDGERTVHCAPALLTIKAGRLHVITAITDVTWHCIHSTTETDPKKVDHVLTGGVA